MTASETLVRVDGLVKHYPVRRGTFGRKGGVLKAVDGVSLFIRRGEVLGLVGESGSGKSTLGRMIVRLIDPDDGRVQLGATDLTSLSGEALRRERRRFQMVFQDPNSSLNPRMTIGDALREALRLHGLAKGNEEGRIAELLRLAELPEDSAERYPHEFSGGQRQRVGLIRALALEPELIVADEPVSALDVSVQAQILALLQRLRAELGLTMLFISHDLDVVEMLADRIIVMYLGRIVEVAPTDALFASPRHPYTRALLDALPKPDPALRGQRQLLKGTLPTPLNLPDGCAFHSRCPLAGDDCLKTRPTLRQVGDEHWVACVHATDGAAS